MIETRDSLLGDLKEPYGYGTWKDFLLDRQMQSSIPRITREQFALWRNSPVTLTVFEFLRAYKAQVEKEHLERWSQGALEDQLETRALGVILFTESFLELSFEAIEAAYNQMDEISDNEQ